MFCYWLGHYVAGLGGQAGAFELHGGVINPKIRGGFLLDGLEDAFAFVHVHVRQAGVQAEGVVAAAERPDVQVVNFIDALDGEDGAGDLLDAHFAGAAFE